MLYMYITIIFIVYSVFEIKPECGLIRDIHQLFVLSMSPKHSHLYESILTCTMNNCPDYKQVSMYYTCNGLCIITCIIVWLCVVYFYGLLDCHYQCGKNSKLFFEIFAN